MVIGKGLTNIGEYAFSRCLALTYVEIPNNVTSIGDGAFYFCEALTSIAIGATGDGRMSIGANTFGYCDKLTSVVIGDCVTSIGENAFNRSNNIRKVFYTGNEEEWLSIDIDVLGNTSLLGANIHYNYVPEE